MKLSQSANLAPLLVLASCRAFGGADADVRAAESEVAAAIARIDERDLLRHITELSSDRYEGRGPGTDGEELTVAYLTEQFAALGLAPGNPDGTYVQKVPLVGFKGTPSISVATKAGVRELATTAECVAVSRRFVPEVRVDDAPLVFVGYGVVAPEYGWDDFKDVDVRGKCVVMLVNDPPLLDPSDPSKLDESIFKGRAMTYYGRWTYKYEVASAKGAAAVFLVHETGPAGYPYEVVSGSWGRENFDVDREDGNAGRVAVEGWFREDVARDLFRDSGLDFDAAKAQALSRDFRPIEMGGSRITARITNALRRIESRNVIAKVEGSSHPDEYVVYTAHWDHLGRDEKREGDQIFNGAVDNASGTAGLLEIAQAFAALDRVRPPRTMLFLAVTAEEKGLLGSKWYASHPLYPLERTLACINMDGLNTWGRTRDVASIGLGNSTLHDALTEAAQGQGRVVVGDSEPEKGYFYRSDHFELAKLGVPGLHFGTSLDFVDKPAGYGQEKSEEYTERDYHKPSDEVRAEWDLSGAVEDLVLFFVTGFNVANADVWPRWNDGAEFKAVREAALTKMK